MPVKKPPMTLLAKGFRPFFLSAAVFAALFVPIWLLFYSSVVRIDAVFNPAFWHAHELVFGFSSAVIAGFLLTAVGNWTRRETAVGWPLLGLVVLWWLGRLCFAFGAPPVLAAVIDGAFLPTVGFVIVRPLVEAENTKNFIMVAMLLGMSAANLMMHAEALGLLAGGQRAGATIALDLVVLMMLVMAARVFPMFTRNGTGVDTVTTAPRLDVATAAAMVVVLVLDVSRAPAQVSGVLAMLTSGLAVARSWRWGARHTLRHPMLWILHLGHAWIAVGLALRGLTAFELLATVSSTHALTVGGIGCLTLGMMARVTRGHTGRQLVASGSTTFAFVSMSLAALVRVFFPVLPGQAHAIALQVSGALWVIAFGVFVVEHAPALWRPRVDGAPG
jgi:uncharacterized protein involved in response to NO